MNCPLCKSEKIKKLDTLDKDKLIELYEKFTTVNFGYLINKDISYCICKKCKLRYYDPLTIGDENFYNTLQKFDWYYMNEKSEYLEVAKYIKVGDKVLDVGSGKGAFAKHLATKDFTGLDTSEEAKKMALKDGIIIENKTIQDYVKEHEESFDVVTSFQVLEHIPNPNSFIKSKIQVLKSGGKLVIAVPSEDSFLKYVSNGILNMPPHHATRWSDETLKFIAKQYNLKLLKIHHENIQDVHKLWYVNTFIQNSMLSAKLLDKSFTRKIVSAVSNILSRILVKGAKKEFLPNGHTVIAIYEKK